MKEMFRMVDKSKVDEVKQMLEYTQKGTAKATVGNYMVVLRNDPLVRESMKYNKLTGRIDIVKKLWWNEEVCKLDETLEIGACRPLTEEELRKLKEETGCWTE